MKALRSPRFGSAACVSTFGVTAVGKAMPVSEFRVQSPGPLFHRSRLPAAGKKSSPQGGSERSRQVHPRLRWLRQSH